MNHETLELFKTLTELPGASGNDHAVRSFIKSELEKYSDEIVQDRLGGIFGVKRGNEDGPTVLVAGHMDEVGFMITQDEEKGIFRFELVGGLDVRQLAGKPVFVGRERVPGVIGAKPIHLTKPDELKSAIPLETLRIDVGPGTNQVKVGDRATFATAFTRLGPSIRGKALDNRLGVAILLELMKNPPPGIDLLLAFTVQEEVGLRGARVAAYTFNPDLAIAVDSTPAFDLPAWDDAHTYRTENTAYNSRLGAGPAIYIADASTLSDPRLVRFLAETAQAHGIPYQFRQPGGGSTDAGAIHKQQAGIPSISVSVPGRYAHSSAIICRISDWQFTLNLLQAALTEITSDLLAQER